MSRSGDSAAEFVHLDDFVKRVCGNTTYTFEEVPLIGIGLEGSSRIDEGRAPLQNKPSE